MNNRLYPTSWKVPGAIVKNRRGYVAGREPLYNNCMDLEAAIDLYFEARREAELPPTFTGLNLWLGFHDPNAIAEWQNPSHPFGSLVLKARQRIEDSLEIMLHQGKPPVGAIFTLKHHAGWRDTQTVEMSGDFTIRGIAQMVAQSDALADSSYMVEGSTNEVEGVTNGRVSLPSGTDTSGTQESAPAWVLQD